MTNKKPESGDEVKHEHVIEALKLLGFEEIMDLQVKTHKGTMKIVVNLSDGKKSVFFRDGSSVIMQDDEAGTLAQIGQVIIDAEKGIIPTIPEQDGELIAGNSSMSEDDPALYTEKPRPVESYPQGPAREKQETINPPAEMDNTPAEIIHNPAAPTPAPFQPHGMMIMDIQPGLAEVGAVKIGGKGEERKSQKSGQPFRLPVKYDHFVILTKIKDDVGNFIVDPIMKKWGFENGARNSSFGDIPDGPKELDIYLLYDEPTSNFMTSYKQYKGGKCLCSGNGIEATKDDGTKIQCNTETCTFFKSKACKPNGILSVILNDAPTLGGVYKFRTTSFNSIRQILSSLFFIRDATGGHLANIPLKMTLTPRIVNPIGSPTAQTVYLVNIVFPGNIDDLHKKTIELAKERATMRKEILAIEAQARLAICESETTEEIQDVEAEFYPEKER